MMEAAHTSETLVHFNDITQHYIPEGYHLHVPEGSVFYFTWRREKSRSIHFIKLGILTKMLN
jgi:hypothetical protein